MNWLDALTEQPLPIYGQFVKRITPLGEWPELVVRKLNPARAHRRAADKARHAARKALLRTLTEKEMERVGGY